VPKLRHESYIVLYEAKFADFLRARGHTVDLPVRRSASSRAVLMTATPEHGPVWVARLNARGHVIFEGRGDMEFSEFARAQGLPPSLHRSTTQHNRPGRGLKNTLLKAACPLCAHPRSRRPRAPTPAKPRRERDEGR
jgi:hypothetical protein